MIASDGSEWTARLIESSEQGWPQFRGPKRDGISRETGLLRSWPDGGPKQLWSATSLGLGFSSPVLVNDRIFITGDIGDELNLFALDRHGQLVWRTIHGASWKTPYPGARATVTYNDGNVYLQNAHGRLACVDAATGQERWAVELLKRFRGENITWGMSECLLVDERAVYATAGSADALIVALSKKTGEVLWKSEPLFDSEGERSIENASYVSPILVQFGPRRLLIGCSSENAGNDYSSA